MMTLSRLRVKNNNIISLGPTSYYGDSIYNNEINNGRLKVIFQN